MHTELIRRDDYEATICETVDSPVASFMGLNFELRTIRANEF